MTVNDSAPAIAQLKADGFAIVPNLLPSDIVQRCGQLIEAARNSRTEASVSNSRDTYGLRNLTDVVPEIAELMSEPSLAKLVTDVLSPSAFLVRSTLFDKTEGANWGVFWHQDLSIAVQEKHEAEGYSAWTKKAGVHCVQPPIEVMQQILTVRIHLDDCTAANGALKVLPGSHMLGRVRSASIDSQQTSEAVTCEVPAGGVLLMRPTSLHASSPMDEPSPRRVIHFEFADFELPEPLKWRYRFPTEQVAK